VFKNLQIARDARWHENIGTKIKMRSAERIPASTNNDSYGNIVRIEPTFCERKCNYYFWGCCCSISGFLVFAFLLSFSIPELGLIVASISPSVVILALTSHYYRDQITHGQMIGSTLAASRHRLIQLF